MSDQFYNPYHFIPFAGTAKENPTTDKAYQEIANGEGEHITHDRWEKNTLSGAIYVALTNKSDLIVGGDRQGDEQNRYVEFYRSHPAGRLDTPRQLGIPGNSLRGMIASTAEIISDSAMRVLGDEYYSVRQDVSSPMQAIGIYRKLIIDNKECHYIEPVALPPVKIDRNSFSVQKVAFFNHLPSLPWHYYLKWNVAVYEKEGKERLKEKPKHPLQKAGISLDCYQGLRNKKYIYVKYDISDQQLLTESLELNNSYSQYYSLGNKGQFLLGLRLPSGPNALLSEEEYVKQGKPKGYIRSFLFSIGVQNREETLANTKINEYLIPYPEEKEQLKSKKETALNFLLPINGETITDFELKTKQSYEKGTLLIPQGWEKLEMKKDEPWRLKSGDLIYFSAQGQGEQIKVTELSYSQIWRKSVTPSYTHQIMAASGHQRYLTWDSELRRNTSPKLTPAEQLFGVVSDLENAAGNNSANSQSLASRVRFYDAVKINPDLRIQNQKTILTLDSPKPPSPAMYLSNAQGQALGKADISDQKTHFQLNGRKRYLQHTSVTEETQRNQGTDAMHTTAESIPPSTTPAFGFPIEFENLSPNELSLLLTSLGAKQNANVPHFYQQLGMGKPYGFGKVSLDVLGVFLKQPQQRYTTLEAQPVYQHVLSGYAPDAEQLALLQKIVAQSENPALKKVLHRYQQNEDIPEHAVTVHHDKNPLIHQTSLDQVAMLADPENFTKHPIHYPLPNGRDKKVFEWFTTNEDNLRLTKSRKPNRLPSADYQALQPLSGKQPPQALLKMNPPLKKK
ncbi:TIGR03986 family type III CRISPR-associated RAMP protein [Vibrio spartinae]|uniref:CRISPR-associated protein n=1 Tax=Vibrio spartinae TaxID=1918945 RepID=A0ABX6R4G5_9VIBR|nr:TIGR03986 family CRISPR-associated RAMP protein [Vibrio spartinae]QMV16211.1 CRISPR-associated protein [Vibrio spartinae]